MTKKIFLKKRYDMEQFLPNMSEFCDLFIISGITLYNILIYKSHFRGGCKKSEAASKFFFRNFKELFYYLKHSLI